MADRTDVASARDLPDGTIVRHEGGDYIAYPEHEVCGQLVRWHSETTIATDRVMDSMLDDGRPGDRFGPGRGGRVQEADGDLMTAPRAADLPVGSVVVDGVQALFRYGPSENSWRTTWSGADRLDDAYVDQTLACGAQVLRVGDGSGQ